MREFVAADIRMIFNAPRLSDRMEEAIAEGLTIFSLPELKRKRLRTSNISENLNDQIKRRTKVGGLFPNMNSILGSSLKSL